jgi:hypothetical protein
MPGALKAASNATLGFLGLNTQESGVTLESGYAKKAINCVIDKYGRLGSRRGWQTLTTNNGDLADSEYIESIFEFRDVGGNSTFLSAGGGKLFSGTTTLTRKLVYGADSGGPVPLVTQPTFSGNRWQWAALQENAGAAAESYAFAAQGGNRMMVYREGAHSGPYVFQRIGDYGTAPSGLGLFDPDCVHAAFGRLWTGRVTENKTTVFYSRLLDGAHFSGTGSGLLDIGAVVGGNDEIVAISSYNKFLIIFCSNNIVVYDNADDPTTIALADVINGVGCIARDSVQQTGTDLIFLSKSGLRSLRRTVEEKSMPMRELSLNIRDDLVNYINGESLTNVKSVYFERDAFYLLVLPGLKQSIYFDLRQTLPNGASRTTIWNNLVPKALCATYDRNLYLGMAGGIGRYFGYDDRGDSYRLEYTTSNTDVGEPFTLKFLKKAKVIVIASGTQDIIIKYGFDYSNTSSSRTYAKDFVSGASQYNISEYNIGEFTSGTSISEIDLNLGGSGKVLEFGVECTIDGAPVSLQQMTVYLKTGKLA